VDRSSHERAPLVFGEKVVARALSSLFASTATQTDALEQATAVADPPMGISTDVHERPSSWVTPRMPLASTHT